MQRRVLSVLRSIYTLTEEDFPDDLKEDWRKLKAADQHPIHPRNQWLIKFKDETEARYEPHEKRGTGGLRAYVNIVIGIAQRAGAIRRST